MHRKAAFLYIVSMAPRAKSEYIPADWPTRAHRFNYRLSRAMPLNAAGNVYRAASAEVYEVHPGIEVGVLLSGRQERYFTDVSLTIRAGDVWLGAAWEPHGMRVLTPNTRTLVMIFLPEFLGEETLGGSSWLSLFAAPPSQRPRVLDETMRARVLDLGGYLWEEVGARAEGWQTSVRLGLLQLLWTLRRGWRPPEETGEAPTGLNNLARLAPILSALHENPAQRLTVSEAAAACTLSPTHFRRVFQKTMGLTFAMFCREARLALVGHLLATTELSVQDIAVQAGFVDGSHLHHNFTKYYHCTPGVFREQNR